MRKKSFREFGFTTGMLRDFWTERRKKK